MSSTVHVVCLDAPSPPNYGGAIDMFCKIEALHGIGLNVILHYFNYNKSRHAKGIEKHCAEIHAYDRKSFLQAFPLSRPFIVHSRINNELINRLNASAFPVLLEGLHCSGVIPSLQNKRRVVLRLHNDEARYYRSLAQVQKSFFKRSYFLHESRLLKKYQQRLGKDTKLACLSDTDVANLRDEYRFQHAHFIPCFLPWQKIRCKEGRSDYCLYHGNLAVAENEAAALWLMQNVFSRSAVPLVVAGNGASNRLVKATGKYANVTLINNPPPDELTALISDAHVHVLPSVNSTGVKLKLLNTLLNGRFCITNKNGVAGSKIEKGLAVKDSANEWIKGVDSLMQKDFSAKDIEDRGNVLALYNNHSNALKLSALWTHCQ